MFWTRHIVLCITVRWPASCLPPQTDGKALEVRRGGCVEGLLSQTQWHSCVWSTNYLCNLIIPRRIPISADLVRACLCFWECNRGYPSHVSDSGHKIRRCGALQKHIVTTGALLDSGWCNPCTYWMFPCPVMKTSSLQCLCTTEKISAFINNYGTNIQYFYIIGVIVDLKNSLNQIYLPIGYCSFEKSVLGDT